MPLLILNETAKQVTLPFNIKGRALSSRPNKIDLSFVQELPICSAINTTNSKQVKPVFLGSIDPKNELKIKDLAYQVDGAQYNLNDHLDSLTSKDFTFSSESLAKMLTIYFKLTSEIKDLETKNISISADLQQQLHGISINIEHYLNKYVDSYTAEYAESLLQYEKAKKTLETAETVNYLPCLNHFQQAAGLLLELSKQGSDFLDLLSTYQCKTAVHLSLDKPILRLLSDTLGSVKDFRDQQSYTNWFSLGLLDTDHGGGQRLSPREEYDLVHSGLRNIIQQFLEQLDVQKKDKLIEYLESFVNEDSLKNINSFAAYQKNNSLLNLLYHEDFIKSSSLESKIFRLKKQADAISIQKAKQHWAALKGKSKEKLLVSEPGSLEEQVIASPAKRTSFLKLSKKYALNTIVEDGHCCFSAFAFYWFLHLANNKSHLNRAITLVRDNAEAVSDELTERMLDHLNALKASPNKIYDLLNHPQIYEDIVFYLRDLSVQYLKTHDPKIQTNSMQQRLVELYAGSSNPEKIELALKALKSGARWGSHEILWVLGQKFQLPVPLLNPGDKRSDTIKYTVLDAQHANLEESVDFQESHLSQTPHGLIVADGRHFNVISSKASHSALFNPGRALEESHQIRLSEIRRSRQEVLSKEKKNWLNEVEKQKHRESSECSDRTKQYLGLFFLILLSSENVIQMNQKMSFKPPELQRERPLDDEDQALVTPTPTCSLKELVRQNRINQVPEILRKILPENISNRLSSFIQPQSESQIEHGLAIACDAEMEAIALKRHIETLAEMQDPLLKFEKNDMLTSEAKQHMQSYFFEVDRALNDLTTNIPPKASEEDLLQWQSYLYWTKIQLKSLKDAYFEVIDYVPPLETNAGTPKLLKPGKSGPILVKKAENPDTLSNRRGTDIHAFSLSKTPSTSLVNLVSKTFEGNLHSLKQPCHSDERVVDKSTLSTSPSDLEENGSSTVDIRNQSSPFGKGEGCVRQIVNRTLPQISQISDELFLHIIGDLFGEDTQLEGGFVLNTINYIEQAIQTGLIKEETTAEGKDSSTEQLLLETFKISKELTEMFSKSSSISLEQFRSHLIKKIKNLNPGHSLFIGGGWLTFSGGHAVLYDVSKNEVGKLKLRIFNTGAGLDSHSSFEVDGKQFILPIKEIDDISLEDVTSYSLLHSLRQMKTVSNKWGTTQLYDAIIGELGKKVTSKQYPVNELFDPQHSGTCSYRSVMAYLHHFFSNKDLYHRIDFKIKLKTLIDFSESNPLERFIDDEQKRKLLQKAITYFSREVIELHEKSIITDEEFELVSPVLSRIYSKMYQANEKAVLLYANKEKRRTFEVTKKEDNRVYYPFKKEKFDSIDIKGKSHRAPFVCLDQIPPLTEESFFNGLYTFTLKIAHFYENHDFDNAIELIRTLTSQFGFNRDLQPGQINVTKVIERLNKEELSDLGEELNHRCSHILIKSILLTPLRAKTLEPSLFLSQMKIIALMNLLFNRYCHINGLEPQNIFSKELKHILDRKNAYFLLFDPKEEKEFLQLNSLVEKDLPKKKIGFFEFEHLFESTIKDDSIYLPFLDWDYLNTQEFQDHFYSFHGKIFQECSKSEKIALTFCTQYEPRKTPTIHQGNFQLPQLFLDARESCTIADYLLKGPLQLDPHSYTTTYGLDNESIDYECIKRNREDIISIKFFNQSPYVGYYDYDRSEYTAEYGNYNKQSYIFPYLHFKKLRKPISLHSLVQENDIRVIEDDNLLYCPSSFFFFPSIRDIQKIGNQRFRAFNELYSSKTLQIINTLGFFKRHLSSLKNPSYQGSFEQLIFEPTILLQALTYSSDQTHALLKQFSEFIKNGYEFFFSLKDADAMFFFLETSSKLTQYIRHIKTFHPDILSSDYNEELLDISTLIGDSFTLDLSQTQKNQNKALLAIHLGKKINPGKQDLQTIFSSYVYYRTHVKSDINKSLHFDLIKTINKHLLSFKKLLEQNSKEASHIINSIIQQALPYKKHHSWVILKDFPLLTGEDKSIAIDLKKGEVTLKGSVTATIDPAILQDPVFQKFFPKIDDLFIERSGETEFEITTQNNTEYRVLLNKGNRVILQKKYNNQWYQYFHPKEMALSEINEILNSTPLLKLAQAFGFLKTYLKNSLEYNGSTLSALTIPAYFLSQDFSLFFSESSNEVLCCDSKTHLPVYRLDLSRINSDTQVSHVLEKLTLGGEKTGLTLIDLHDPQVNDLFFISRFESRDYTLIWKHHQFKEIKSIEFPRYGLSFNTIKDSENRPLFYSSQYKGYFISKNQFVEGLGNYGNFLVIENKQGKRLVIFPNRPLKKEAEQSSLVTNLPLYENEDKKVSTLTIPLNSQNRFDYYKLELKQKIHLAKIFLSEQIYEEAMDVLQLSRSSIELFSANEQEHLLELISSSKLKDHDPRAIFLQVKSAGLLAKNLADFLPIESYKSFLPEKILSYIPQIKKTYIEYLKIKYPFDRYFLEKNEEIALLNLLTYASDEIRISPIILKRLNKLDPEKYDETITLLTLQRRNQGKTFTDTTSMKELKSYDLDLKQNLSVYAIFMYNGISDQNPFLLLDPKLSIRQFYEFYKLAKNEDLSKDALISLFSKTFQIDLPGNLPLDQIKEEIKKAFHLMYISVLSSEDSHSRCLALTLNAVFHHPQSFPSSEKFPSMLSANDDEKELFFDNIIEKAQAFYTNEITHSEKEPLTIPPLDEPLEVDNISSIPISSKKVEYSRPANSLHLDRLAQPIIPGIFFEPITKLSDQARQEAARFQFQSPSNNPILQNEIDITSEAFTSYQKVEAADSVEYRVKDLVAFGNWIDYLSSTTWEIHKELLDKEINLLMLANKKNNNELKNYRFFGDLLAAMNLKEAKLLFSKRRLSAYREKNPDLSPENCDKLDKAIQDYLLLSTYYQHIQRVIQHSRLFLEKVNHFSSSRQLEARDEQVPSPTFNPLPFLKLGQKYVSHAMHQDFKHMTSKKLTESSPRLQSPSQFNHSNIDESYMSYLVKDLMRIIFTTRHYSIIDHPEYLVFEDAMNMLLYKDQVNNLEIILDNGKQSSASSKNRVLEMIVGSGKTSVLAPIITHQAADGKRLSVFVLPASLFASMSKEIEKTLNTAFRQEMQSFDFNRETKLTSKDLEWIYQELQLCIEKKKILIMTPQSIQSFYLMTIESFYKYLDNNNPKMNSEYHNQIKLYKKILSLFKQKGTVLIDEIDTILDPLKEHHFTFEKQIPNLESIQHAADIYKTITLNPSLKKLLPILNQEKTSRVSKETYHTTFKPLLINALLSGNFIKQDRELNRFLSGEPMIEAVRKFFLNDDYSVFSGISGDYIKNKLALAKEMIESLLPITLLKQPDEHFGLSKRDTHVKIAIPYHGSNNPVEGSRFGTIYETINYTYQLYLKKGIPKDLLLKTIHSLKKQFANESNNRLITGIADSDAFKRFQQFASTAASVNAFINIDNNINYVWELVNQNPQNIISFVDLFILPEIDVFSKHTRVTPQLYTWMFNQVNGFTGTLWNFDSFPEGMQSFPSQKATGKILSNLYKNSFEDVHIIKEASSLKQLVNRIFSLNDGDDIHALIDVGAYFKHFSNLETAHAILHNPIIKKRDPLIKGVVFYDEENNQKILLQEKDRIKIIDYATGVIPKNQLITLYDQKHTTGSNIPQAMKAKGILTIGPQITLRDFIQGSGRMRQLDGGQTVGFVISEEIVSLLNEELNRFLKEKLKSTDSLTLNEIIQFSIIHQSNEKGNNNFRASKAKFDSAIEFSILDYLLSDSIATEALKEVLEKFRDYFILQEDDQPFKQFSSPSKELKKEEVIDQLFRSFHKKTELISAFLKPIPDALFKESNQREFHKKLMETLPSYLLQKDTSYQFEVETEKETEVEMQTEVNKEEAFDFGHDCVNLDHFLWKKEFSDQTPPFPDFLTASPTLSFDSNSPFLTKISVKDLLRKHRMFFKYRPIFDSNLAATQNIIPVTSNEIDMIFHPFSFEMRSSNHALIIQEEGSDTIDWIMLDEKNAAILKDSSSKEITRPGRDNPNVKPYKIALYHLHLDEFSKRGDNSSYILDVDQLRLHPKFLTLKVQMQFFNGHTIYTDKEAEALKVWIKEKGLDAVRSFFEKEILPNKDYNAKHYKTSTLYQLFQTFE